MTLILLLAFMPVAVFAQYNSSYQGTYDGEQSYSEMINGKTPKPVRYSHNNKVRENYEKNLQKRNIQRIDRSGLNATFIPKDFHTMYWTEEHKDAYFPRPRGYAALNANASLTTVNDRYLQNVAYCRVKNVTVGYSLPKKWVEAIKMQALRIYFTGDNLAYWSPGLMTSYVDPEQAINGGNLRVYSWMKTFMFGIDITF